MIIYKNKWFCTNSDYPNEDWIGDADYVLPDGSDLANKVISYAPNFEFVFENEKITDVIQTSLTEEQLSKLKSEKINYSKTLLSEWLAAHPLLYTDGQYYSCTEEKQSLLNSNLASYERALAAGMSYPLKWNSTGAECTVWTYTDLITLSLTIADYVAPKVSLQQYYEVQIKAATTREQIESVVINYD